MNTPQDHKPDVRGSVLRRLRVPVGGEPPGTGSSPSTDNATVSVVIPCYNYGRYLAEAVTSVLAQPGVDVDVIIVDDCSTDDSAEQAELLAAADDRVRLIRLGTNQGPVTAFNIGLAQAAGEFLVRLDADDLLTPGSLSRAIGLARAFPSVGLVYGHPIHFVDGEQREPARTDPTAWTVWPGREWVEDRCADGVNVITSAEVVMRADVVARVGGQRPLAHTHDMEMWLRIAAFSDVGYVNGADQAWHRDHAQSLSAREVDVVVDLQERRLAFWTLFDGPAGELEWAANARHAADRALDRQILETMAHELDVNREVTPTFSRLEVMPIEASPANLRRKRAIIRRAQRSWRLDDLVTGSARRARHRVRRVRTIRNWQRNGVY